MPQLIIFFFFLVDKGIQGVALYPIYCLINHSCYSNTNYVKFPDLHLELRSQIPIKKGEQIYTRYISATIGMLSLYTKDSFLRALREVAPEIELFQEN